MKNLNEFINKFYVSIEDVDEALQDKIKNLDGHPINECCYDDCCNGCCGDETKCCEIDPCIKPVVDTSVNSFGRFNSELDITRELDNMPKVSTLYDIFAQFDRFNFVQDVKRGHIEPLYFGYKDYNIVSTGEAITRQNGDMPDKEANPEGIQQLYDVQTNQNKKIYKVVKDIVDNFDFRCPIIETKINGEVQVYVVKNTGTNGKENSIKSSLEEVAKILGKLDAKDEIKWSQVLDVSIDNIDDLYSFVITFVLNANKVRETIKTEKLLG